MTTHPTPFAWRKHAVLGLSMAFILGFFALTEGGRQASRADALAVTDLTQDALADEALAAALTQAQGGWSLGRAALGAAHLRALVPPEGLSVRVVLSSSAKAVETPIQGALRRAGLNPNGPSAPVELHISAQGLDDQHPSLHVRLAGEGSDVETTQDHLAGPWWSILPPLVAVAIALAYRQVLFALGGAVLVGAFAAFGPNPLTALWRALGYLLNLLTDPSKLYVLGFTLALVGMIHLSSHTGGQQGLVELFRRFARTARSTRLVTALMGLVVFFDDYANALIVGASAKPLTDRVKVSREKLSFIVDATAAPVAGIALISTWVGYEVGLFDALSKDLALGHNGIDIFISILPSRFYCFFMLGFVFLGAALSRDFGPMLRAERRAATLGQLSRPGALVMPEPKHANNDAPPRWQNAVFPIVLTLSCVVVGMVWNGFNAVVAGGDPAPDLATWAGLRAVFSAANNAFVLFWSAIAGSVLAILMAAGQRVLSPVAALKAWAGGMRLMALPLSILLLAWCMQLVTNDLGTSYYLISVLEPVLSASTLPLVAFLAASAVAFATGTSWGTMGILLPALTPMAWVVSGQDFFITALCMGAVLDGAIFGDHCSPVSDTTVMSSLSCGCDHIDHVRTQLPYALVCMLIAAVWGYIALPIASLPIVVIYAGGFATMLAVLFFVGRPIEPPSASRSV